MTSCQVLDPLKSIDVERETIQQEEDEEDACVNDEFILENSCYCSSKCGDDDQPDNVATDSVKASQSVVEFENTKAGSILKTASISLDRTLRPMESEPLFDPSLSNLPFSDDFQSPSSRTPPKALAQSTPKPTPSRVVEKEQGGLMDTKDSGTSICKTYDSRKSEPGKLACLSCIFTLFNHVLLLPFIIPHSSWLQYADSNENLYVWSPIAIIFCGLHVTPKVMHRMCRVRGKVRTCCTLASIL